MNTLIWQLAECRCSVYSPFSLCLKVSICTRKGTPFSPPCFLGVNSVLMQCTCRDAQAVSQRCAGAPDPQALPPVGVPAPPADPPPAPCSPPAPQCPQERSPSDRPPLPSWSCVSRGEGGVHTLCKVGLPSRSPPSFCTAAVFSASLLLGEAFGGS